MDNSSPYQSTMAVKYELKLNRGSSKTKARSRKKIKKLPHVTRLLALAHHLQNLVDKGIVADYADIARLSGITRARVTQIVIKVEDSAHYKVYSVVPQNILDKKLKAGELLKTNNIFSVVEG